MPEPHGSWDRRGAQAAKTISGGGVRVLLEEVMLGRPDVVEHEGGRRSSTWLEGICQKASLLGTARSMGRAVDVHKNPTIVIRDPRVSFTRTAQFINSRTMPPEGRLLFGP